MRWLIVLSLILSILSCVVGYVVPSSRIERLGKELRPLGETCEEQTMLFDLTGEEWMGAVILDHGERGQEAFFSQKNGRAAFVFDESSSDLSLAISEKLCAAEEVDYRAFAFVDRLPPLCEPLSLAEVAYVFARIVSAATEKVPIDAGLAEIAFTKEDSTLSVCACITLGLDRLSKAYGIAGLPECAVFSASMSFYVENAEISVDLETITVVCETFELPEALLIFACNLAFGKKDYKRIFGEAVRNVLVNARICG